MLTAKTYGRLTACKFLSRSETHLILNNNPLELGTLMTKHAKVLGN